MEKQELKKLIAVAAGDIPSDLVLTNCKIIDIYTGKIKEGNIAISGQFIAGIGDYKGKVTIDGQGKYAAPGFIDGHIHIESSYLCPEELGKLLVPHGTTTIIADPHEIANVCGLIGLDYMLKASQGSALDIKMMLPSCVPATPFEHSGATITSREMTAPLATNKVLGLGEFMNYPGVIAGEDEILNKLLAAINTDKIIDGHSPGLQGLGLNAYAAAGVKTDHECATVKEMEDRLSCGFYVLLRQGSACHNLETLVKGVTPFNSRRCLLCADDLQAKTILSQGHIDHSLRLCVKNGLDPLLALQMATLNAAECYGLKDRGALSPGLKANIVLLDDLKEFRVNKTFINGQLVAQKGEYLLPLAHEDSSVTQGKFKLKDFSPQKLKLKLTSSKVHVIKVIPGEIVTTNDVETVKLSSKQEFVYNPQQDIVKVAVVERHQNTGNVAVALLKGYGLKQGALAVSVAHDSHNIIVVGVRDEDMAIATEQLAAQGGGIILVKNGEILEKMPLPIAGLMTDQTGAWVDQKLVAIHKLAHEALGVKKEVEPIMTLSFMSLAVIPELKLTDMGLFDVKAFKFIALEAQ